MPIAFCRPEDSRIMLRPEPPSSPCTDCTCSTGAPKCRSKSRLRTSTLICLLKITSGKKCCERARLSVLLRSISWSWHDDSKHRLPSLFVSASSASNPLDYGGGGNAVKGQDERRFAAALTAFPAHVCLDKGHRRHTRYDGLISCRGIQQLWKRPSAPWPPRFCLAWRVSSSGRSVGTCK